MYDEKQIVITCDPKASRRERWSASSSTSNHASLTVNGSSPTSALRKLLLHAGSYSIEARFRGIHRQ